MGEAAAAGVQWLLAEQQPAGHWLGGGSSVPGDAPGDFDSLSHSSGVTGLALLAIMGAGEFERYPARRGAVLRGLRYLIDSRKSLISGYSKIMSDVDVA